MRGVLRAAGFAALLLTAMILAEVPALRALAAWIDARGPTLLAAVAVVLALGFALFFVVLLKLLMDRDEALDHSAAEDVTRSVKLAARPVFSRSSHYRVIGRAAGRRGSDTFRLHDLKAAWRSGALWRDPVSRRRALITAGALLIVGGILACLIVVGAPWVKVLSAGLLAYVGGRLTVGWARL